MSKTKRKTQRERAEEWARSCVFIDADAAMNVFDGKVLVAYGGREAGAAHIFQERHAAPIRALLVATWMRARRVRA